MFPKRAHSAIICGATDCGKTEFVLDLLETEYQRFFDYIIIICPTWMHNKAYLNRPWFFKDDCPSWYPKSSDWLNECLKLVTTYMESKTLILYSLSTIVALTSLWIKRSKCSLS